MPQQDLSVAAAFSCARTFAFCGKFRLTAARSHIFLVCAGKGTMDEVLKSLSQSMPMLGNMSRHAGGGSTRLVVLKEGPNKPNTETVNKDGEQKTVHVIVKNAPFHFHIGVAQTSHSEMVDLNKLAFEVKLLYDHKEGEAGKEVAYVKQQPIEYKVRLNDQGNQCSFEIRLKVLTSQHEDMFFRVRISIVHPGSSQIVQPNLSIESGPIKVISKPEKPKKKAPVQNKSINDVVVDAVSRIEQNTLEQEKAIERLYKMAQTMPPNKHPRASSFDMFQNNRPELDDRGLSLHQSGLDAFGFGSLDPWQTSLPPFGSTGLESASSNTPLTDNQKKKDLPEGLNFERAFEHFLVVCNTVPQEEKPAKIRRLIRQASVEESKRITEFLGLFSEGGLERASKRISMQTTPGCSCATCPYQKELQNIDQFYDGILMPE